jgi:DNA-binding SARP family transcriptional activator/tetratricopeptide (TPR) repeat protein
VLAALAVDASRPVSVEVLLDRVWGPVSPPRARRTLHTHITRIRRLLETGVGATESATVARHGGGYVLDIDPECVDLLRFRRLVKQARERGCPDGQRAALLRECLDLWQGQPLAGIPGQWAARSRDAWRQEYLEAVIAWAESELRLGNPTAVTGALTELLDEHPLVEAVTVTLMRALSAAGRSNQALACYATTRQRLVEELGVDPGAELQELHHAILRGEVHQPAPSRPPLAAPAQLPLDVASFTGRTAQLAQLDALLAAPEGRATAAVVSILSGTAGVGKTALAVHWAHRVADRFPDGQLYVNLRGFDPSGSAMDPADAIRGFLDAFGTPPSRIPHDTDAQVGLYRSLLAGRRVLLILDNARDANQVRPLLPGTAGCLALITSRNQLTGIVATEGAHPVTLDLLGRDECQRLLALRLGHARVAAEPEAVDEIIASCARLPLALAIVGARAATHPDHPLAILVKELTEPDAGLDAFAADDPSTDMRAVFSWSYRTLTVPAARLFRLLGLHPGPDVGIPAAASLAGIPVSRVRSFLSELTRTHLLTEPAPSRYAFHDLLRAYARELTQTTDPDDERHAALRRMFDSYLHTAFGADRLLDPLRDPIRLETVQSDVATERFADDAAALAWFTAEHAVLLLVQDLAARTGFDADAWQLGRAMATSLDRRGRWHDLAHTQSTALDAARRRGDRPAQARTLLNLSRPMAQTGSYDKAESCMRLALDIYTQLADRVGRACANFNLASVMEHTGQYHEALRHAQTALDQFTAAGHGWRARALNRIGACHLRLGSYQEAVTYCGQSLDLTRDNGDRPGEASALMTLGKAYQHLGRAEPAVAHYRLALDVIRHLGDRYYEADILSRMGDTHHTAGEDNAARAAWRQALLILDELAHPAADQLRVKLGAPSAAGPPA